MLDSGRSEFSPLKMPTASEVLEAIEFPELRVGPYLDQVLLDPLNDMGSRKAKNIRRRIVEIAYGLAGEIVPQTMDKPEHRKAIDSCGRILEQIHVASLIVDDIEDDSEIRRGKETLHRKYGMPVALNAGNWLYFWQLHELRTLNLAPEIELRLYRYCMDMYVRAHCGQAFDVGMSVDRVKTKDIPDFCLASIRLKTGALMKFAMGVAGILGDASDARRKVLEDFGEEFGIALQCFDDIGNTSTRMPPEKRFEDLKLMRPTWLWSVAAEELSHKDFTEFFETVKQYRDDPVVLDRALERIHLRQLAYEKADGYLTRAVKNLETSFSGLSNFTLQLGEIQHLANVLRSAYGC